MLLVNALNGLQRAASVRLKARPFDLTTAHAKFVAGGGGLGSSLEQVPEEGSVSPPEGFEAAKAHYVKGPGGRGFGGTTEL